MFQFQDYVGFDLANENDELEAFLKLPLSATTTPPTPAPPATVINGREVIVQLFLYLLRN